MIWKTTTDPRGKRPLQSLVFPSRLKFTSFLFKKQLMPYSVFVPVPQLRRYLEMIRIHEILLFNTKTKMKLMLSMHPWVSFCTAELNMSPFLSPGGAMVSSLPSSLKLVMFEEGESGCEGVCVRFFDHFHIWELKLVTFWREVKLRALLGFRWRGRRNFGGSQLIGGYVTSVQQKRFPVFST